MPVKPWKQIGSPEKATPFFFSKGLILQRFVNPLTHKLEDFYLYALRNSVVVLAVTTDHQVIVTREFMQGANEIVEWIGGGLANDGETLEQAARRELLEETGYTARRFRKLLDVFPTPGFVSERMLVYAVDRLIPGDAGPDADERIQAKYFSLRQLEILIRRGKLRDAKSIAGILYYARFGRKPVRR